MGDWGAKQRALRKYEYDAPTRPDRRGPDVDPTLADAPDRGPRGGGFQGGVAVLTPAPSPVDEQPREALGQSDRA
jgi:hypothetical protein